MRKFLIALVLLAVLAPFAEAGRRHCRHRHRGRHRERQRCCQVEQPAAYRGVCC